MAVSVMVVPAAAVFGLTTMVTVAVLLAVLVSPAVVVATAVSVSVVPAAAVFGLTRMVIVALAPAARVPRLIVTVPLAELLVDPDGPVAEMKVTLAGRLSVTT